MIKTLEWTDEGVRLLDQTRLPTEEIYVTCATYEEVADAIRKMIVRGAPAIGVTAAMGIALGLKKSPAADARALRADMESLAALLAATRPTAVNLFWAIDRMKRSFAEGAQAGESPDELATR
ncbi:MAG: S-methyl-5-thioribose-1-phosphate isomerase, partial [Nevskiales bacterium]